MVGQEAIFVIIPVYNEATTIATVLESVLSHGYTVVVVNDGSSDDSAQIIRRFPVYYLEHAINLGQGAALQTGLSFAVQNEASYIVTFDADGQHDANDITKLISPLLLNRADVCFGSRFLKGADTNISTARKTAVNLARYLNYFLSGVLLSDAHNGLRAFNRRAAASISITEPGMAHASEIHIRVVSSGLRLEEVAVSVLYTEYSKSKGQSAWNSFRIFFDLMIHKFSR